MLLLPLLAPPSYALPLHQITGEVDENCSPADQEKAEEEWQEQAGDGRESCS